MYQSHDRTGTGYMQPVRTSRRYHAGRWLALAVLLLALAILMSLNV
jgi:hypothetical protein